MKRDAFDYGIAFGDTEDSSFEPKLFISIDYSTFEVHAGSMHQASAEFLGPLLSMGEERSAELHFSWADNCEIISEIFHFTG